MATVKKAEKSRIHAKQRRTEESKEITEIANLLPLPTSVTKRLDKASILRLAITFLRLKQYVGEGNSRRFNPTLIIGIYCKPKYFSDPTIAAIIAIRSKCYLI